MIAEGSRKVPLLSGTKALLAEIQGRRCLVLRQTMPFIYEKGVHISESLYVLLMKKLNDLEYLKLNAFRRFVYNFLMFLAAIPVFFVNLGKGIGRFFVNLAVGIKDGTLDIFRTFKEGNWAVKLSFLIFGMGNLYYGQIMRGLFFLLFEVIFIAYMLVPSGGLYWMGKVNWFQTGSTIGTVQGGKIVEEVDYNGIKIPVETWVDGDDSVKVLLYGLLTVIFIIAFIWTWRLQVKQCRICMDITAQGKKVRIGRDSVRRGKSA